jgi:hypothetical protein
MLLMATQKSAEMGLEGSPATWPWHDVFTSAKSANLVALCGREVLWRAVKTTELWVSVCRGAKLPESVGNGMDLPAFRWRQPRRRELQDE